MTRTRWLLLLGLVGVGTLATLFLLKHAPEEVLLAKRDVSDARDHLALRAMLASPAGRSTEAGEDEDTRLAFETHHALLQSRLRKSRFAYLSTDDLERALEAAEAGRFAESVGGRGVYGKEDDRQDHGEVTARLETERNPHERAFLESALEVSKGVGAWMDRRAIRERRFVARTLGDAWKLCSGERFADQPIAARGTAFLVAPDVVATAAHVLKDMRLADLALVFDYEVRNGENPVEASQVYYARRVLKIDKGNGKYDYAIVQLDRPVEGGRVLRVASKTRRMKVRDAVYMWGHSAGTPKKLTRGSILRNSGKNSMRLELDAFGGDSGSPVLNEDHEVVGILFGGSEDYRVNQARGGCRVAVQVSRKGGEYATRAEVFHRHLPR